MIHPKIAIIGAGPAGIAAAIQLHRHDIKAALFEQGAIGGLLNNANLIENYPGFTNGLTGSQMCKLLTRHLKGCEIEVRKTKIESVTFQVDLFHLATAQGVESFPRVIIASGTVPIELDLPGLSELVGKSVFYEVRNLKNLQNQHIAIIGAGDAAFDYALTLSEHNQVTILNRGSRISCLPLLWSRCEAKPMITYRNNAKLSSVFSFENQLALTLRDGSREERISTDYLLIAIGRKPNLEFVAPDVLKNIDNLTNRGILYWIGDVANGLNRQLGIAVGNGIEAAMSIARSMKGNI